MPKRMPISSAKDIANKFDCKQVIIAAWDGERTHIVTYGKSAEDCDQAAQGGNLIKKAMGWPKSMLNDEPSRIIKMKSRIIELEQKVKELSETQ
jgi:hypothetical protein